MALPGSRGGCACAEQIDQDARILRKLDVSEGVTGEGDPASPYVCTVLDVETTGTDHGSDALIQLGLRRFRCDEEGRITRIDRPYSWFEDPGRPIPPEVVRITGITDEMVQGHEIDRGAVKRILQGSSLIVAHNAAFDRRWVEAQVPEATGLAWGCSMADVDWASHGFDGRSLGFLGMQCGFWFEAHRADADVDAVIGLLRHRFPDGRTVLAELLDTARQPSWLVHAQGAAFGVKDRLRARGYRWNPSQRVWSREVKDEALTAEEFWLAANVYCVEASPRALGPRLERVDCWSRYA
ncbi:DNA polymerase III subunit epsilon [Sphingomonas sp. MAH-20]|uniref:DNA polymerase III subunit epsilon n=1 Tax=Sphingomonas horti TaxID=2682842 RepID=A0A6I4IXJ9_9SPHN|nr:MULTISPECIES: 3'-5' exonuclease [Sphingomonas]MBA2920831.1 DNA polymerase III subunit epsilon [Sphingomonas sp. CGMCC 1.13658]MVO76817.1 DNA polymerase III subunit epsilon [Sphingomonas horti]